ncbi:unnamed protein product [Spodoptera littoralis]|uniref:Endosome-associated-trafficking regulator 1 n=1 Tax=Spodoptera littoralis TaxID=7109 RepID=A0A9P0I1N5_SPOLI|nr:unnamed protein product [Spodoptera littoralis]CAH1638517.1 unnamed protein product [Spodoptera littoralis]
MCLPDFLPVHPGRTSPEPEHQDEQMQQIMAELERTRSELFAERSRRCRVEEELALARAAAAQLRADAHVLAQRRAHELDRAGPASEPASRTTDSEATIARLKNQIKKLKEELSASESEARSLRGTQAGAAAALRRATGLAETSLRELLSGLDQLKTLSSSLDPT